MGQMRLDKYLADAGRGTRSVVKSLVKSGRVKVDGVVIRSFEYKVQDGAEVCVDGNPVVAEKFQYFILNKPAGVVSATKDTKDKTVLDLIDCNKRRDLFPVGRLDKDTEGLLVITNDGKLSQSLLAPGKHVEKCYYVETEGELPENLADLFSEGVDIGDEKPTAPAELTKGEKPGSYFLTITEGRFHQVKRMFSACGGTVTFLKRIRMGGLALPEDLAPGEFRRLTKEELELLLPRG